ncbi:MAG TPA: FAD:protein FMN transferase [Deltaproteobacteria bacterium]|nr:FAD:protein FMN transferase [Deltaproteobacteria bacterium]
MSPQLELDRRTLRLIAIAFALLAALSIHRLYFAGLPEATDALVLQGRTMGTSYEIRVAGDGLDESLRQRVLSETRDRLARVDGWMSNWNPESEISRFNAFRSTSDFPVSSETAEVVSFALELNAISGGAFDITVGPLVALWGFGSHARIDSPPSDEEIARLRRHTGAGALHVHRDPETGEAYLRKRDPEVEIDLSAIAKGFGVDQVAEGLEELGRRDFLVEIGGEIRTAGERPGGGPWRIAVERPQDEGRAIQEVIELQDRAMATSGDYRIFYLEGSRRISHTIDPRTGRPVEGGPASVTTLADSAMRADAWATALMVLGAEPGLALAEQNGIAALVLKRDAKGAILERPNALFPEAAGPPTRLPQRG